MKNKKQTKLITTKLLDVKTKHIPKAKKEAYDKDISVKKLLENIINNHFEQ